MSRSDDADPRDDPRLAEAARLLDEAAREEERDIAAAATLADAPGLARYDELSTDLWREVDRRRRFSRRIRGVGLMAAAAAVIGVLFLGPWRAPHDGGPSGELLGESAMEILPHGEVSAWDRIEWRGPGGPWVLRVLDADSRAPVLGPLRVLEPRYTPTSEESARWPARIVIEIEWRLPDGTPQQASAEARLAR